MADNNSQKVFTQEDVNRIVAERLAQERKKYEGREDYDAIKAELDSYRADRAHAEMVSRVNACLGDRKFSHKFVEDGIVSAFSKALLEEENKGKTDSEIFDSLTMDEKGILPGIFHPAVTGSGGYIAPMGGFQMDNVIAEAFKPKI